MKKLMLFVIIGLNLNILQANMVTEGIENFIKKVSKMTKGKVDDVVKQIPKRTINMTDIKTSTIRLPKLSTKVKADPARLLLAEKSTQIVSKGNFEKKFFQNQNFDNQLALIVQSSKYGDEYFTVAKQISNISPKILSSSSPFVNYIRYNQLNEKILQTKFIDTLNKTGKWGWKKIQNISAWVAENKAVSGVSGTLAWYILDPESFDDAMKESGKTLTEFLSSIIGDIAQGMGEAINKKVEQIHDTVKQDTQHYFNGKIQNIKVSTMKSVNVIVGLLVFGLLFIAWRKRKIIKHFLIKADEIKVKNYIEEDNNEF